MEFVFTLSSGCRRHLAHKATYPTTTHAKLAGHVLPQTRYTVKPATIIPATVIWIDVESFNGGGVAWVIPTRISTPLAVMTYSQPSSSNPRHVPYRTSPRLPPMLQGNEAIYKGHHSIQLLHDQGYVVWEAKDSRANFRDTFVCIRVTYQWRDDCSQNLKRIVLNPSKTYRSAKDGVHAVLAMNTGSHCHVRQKYGRHKFSAG